MPQVYVFSNWFFPAYKAGGPVQSLFNLLTEDNQTGYRLVTSNKDIDGTVLEVKVHQWVNFSGNAKIWYTRGTVKKKLLDQTQGKILFLNGIYSWQFTVKPILFSKAARKILSVRGMLHPGALAQKPLKKKLYLRWWKWAGLHRRVEFHATSMEEEAYIKQQFGKEARVHVIANLPRIFSAQPVLNKKTGALNLVTVALISPMKNILLVLEALKELKEEVNYQIYGPVKDLAYWQQCLAAIKQLPANITVACHGDIKPDRVEEALRTTHVFIQPSKAENFSHSIIEALSAGKPVITSWHTPWQELEKGKAGLNVSLKENSGLVEAIRFFAKMPQGELEEWSRGAARYAEKAADVEGICRQYQAMFSAAPGTAKEAVHLETTAGD